MHDLQKSYEWELNENSEWIVKMLQQWENGGWGIFLFTRIARQETFLEKLILMESLCLKMKIWNVI